MESLSLEAFRKRIYTAIFAIGWCANAIAWLFQILLGNAIPGSRLLFLVGFLLIPILAVLTWLPRVPLRIVDMLTVGYVAGISFATISIHLYGPPSENVAALQVIYMWTPVVYIFTFSIARRMTALWTSVALWLIFLGLSLPYVLSHLDLPQAQTNIQFQFMSALFIVTFFFFATFQKHLRLARLSADEYASLANTDSLTQLANRRCMHDLISKEHVRFVRYQHRFSVILLDIDHFKQFNDNFGHDVGDKILQALAKRISEILREVDTPARWGGEEFIVLLPETSFTQAMYKAELIRMHISEEPLLNQHSISISCGVSEVATGDSVEELLKRADTALYEAKNAGRNLVRGREKDSSTSTA